MPGGFAEISAVELGSTAIAESISRSGVEAKDVDEVLIGNGLSAGRGQNVARQVAVKAGVPQSVAKKYNKADRSGMMAALGGNGKKGGYAG